MDVVTAKKKVETRSPFNASCKDRLIHKQRMIEEPDRHKEAETAKEFKGEPVKKLGVLFQDVVIKVGDKNNKNPTYKDQWSSCR